MIQGSGSILSTKDEQGNDIPFMTTDQILKELQRFGFIVFYDVKRNLPTNILAFLSTVNNLGFDKITRVCLQSQEEETGTIVWRPTILVIKSADNSDLLEFDCKLTRKAFNKKLTDNTIMNVTHEDNMKWDWLTYIANIDDILSENVDDSDQYEPVYIDELDPPLPMFSDGSMTPYGSEEVDDDEDGDITPEPLEGEYVEP